MSDNGVRRGTLIIGFSVALSAALGLLRDILLARMVGTGYEKDAYELAFLIPDIINHLISTGYLSITFIPLFTGYLTSNNKQKGWEFFSNILNCFSLILIPLLILCWIGARDLIVFFTSFPGSEVPDPQTLDLAVKYSRIVLPAQFFFFIGALFTAAQHVGMRFLLPALNGLIYNAFIIICGWLGRDYGLTGFAAGALLGAIAGSGLLQVWGGIRAGARFFLVLNFTDKGLRKYIGLTLPLILGLGAVFALELVFRIFGTGLGESGVARLSYAYRLMYMLVRLFGFSVGVASYPLLARLAVEGAAGALNKALFDSWAKILSILSLLIIVLVYESEILVKVLYERGQFQAQSTIEVAALLRIYLISAIPLSFQIILLRCYYAQQRMWLPTVINTVLFAAFLPLYPLAIQIKGIQGVPLTGAVCSLLQVSALLALWIKLNGSSCLRGFLSDAFKTAVSTLPFILALHFLMLYAGKGFSSMSNLVIGPIISGTLIIVITGGLQLQSIMGVKAARSIMGRGTVWIKSRLKPF